MAARKTKIKRQPLKKKMDQLYRRHIGLMAIKKKRQLRHVNSQMLESLVNVKRTKLVLYDQVGIYHYYTPFFTLNNLNQQEMSYI